MRASTATYRTSLRGVAVWVAGLLMLFVLLGLSAMGYFRIALSLAVTGVLVGVSLVREDVGVLATLSFLFLLGELRRVLIVLDGWPAFDPLLLIGSGLAIMFVASATARGSLSLDTALSKCVFLLLGVMALQVFNPLQGGLMIGVAGAMFYIIPLFWFWVGKAAVSEDMLSTIVFKFVVVVGLLASALSLYQTFVGYLPHQMMWYNVAGYGSLGPLFALKPISFFSSSTENGVVMSMAAIVLIGLGVTKDKRYFLLAIPLLVSVFLIGSRGPIVRIVVAGAVVWAVLSASRQTWVLRMVLAIVVGFGGLYWSSKQVPTFEGDGAASYYLERQTSMFANPLDKKESSLGTHSGMFFNGVKRGILNPIGFGLGSSTKASYKLSGEGFSTEVDLSNIFLSTGVVGGLLFMAIMFLASRACLNLWHKERSVLILCVGGILVFSLGGWLNGGRYFFAPLLWVLIGAVDRRYAELNA